MNAIIIIISIISMIVIISIRIIISIITTSIIIIIIIIIIHCYYALSCGRRAQVTAASGQIFGGVKVWVLADIPFT